MARKVKERQEKPNVVIKKPVIKVHEEDEWYHPNYRITLDGTLTITQDMSFTGCVIAGLSEDDFVKMALPLLENRLRQTYRRVEVYDRFA